MSREPFAIDAVLAMNADADADPRAPGGEVTVALCGHWEHEGACRWPHNSRLETDTDAARLRTVVVAPGDEHEEIARRVELGLRADGRWVVMQFATGVIAEDERELADRLARS